MLYQLSYLAAGAQSSRLLEERVLVGVRRRAAAEEAELTVAVVLQRVPGAGGHRQAEARADATRDHRTLVAERRERADGSAELQLQGYGRAPRGSKRTA